MTTTGQRLTRSGFKSLAAERGWSMANLAWRWGISPEHLSREVARADRDIRWDDAVKGLPSLTRREAAVVTRERLRVAMARPKRRQEDQEPLVPPSGFRYHADLTPGAVVVVSESLGSIEEGQRGVVIATEVRGAEEWYRIRFPQLEEWFSPDLIDRHLVATGELRALS